MMYNRNTFAQKHLISDVYVAHNTFTATIRHAHSITLYNIDDFCQRDLHFYTIIPKILFCSNKITITTMI